LPSEGRPGGGFTAATAGTSTGPCLAATAAGSPTATPAGTASSSPSTAASATAAGEASPFARIVGSLGQETNRGEAAMKRALSAHGSDLGAADLLALQAGVYRYGEVVDLASRLVDRATSNVKTVLQGSGS
jgi:hypothetical protein